MRVVAQTRLLLAAVFAVAAADVAVHTWRWWSVPEPVPTLPSFDPRDAVSITITRTDDVVSLERGAEGWTLAAPVRAAADGPEVDALLGVLSGGVRPDARLSDPDQETYGLTGGAELQLDVRSANGALLDLVVGKDAGGGSTWIRRAGDDAVLRAAIGGRARLERPAGAWLDRAVTNLDPASVRGVTVRWAAEVLESTRGPDGWTGTVDGPTLDRLVAAASHLRAVEVSAEDRAGEPVVSIELDTDPPVTLVLSRAGDVWVVRRTDGPTVWRIELVLPELVATPSLFTPRDLWRVDPASVSRIVLEHEGQVSELVREGDGFRVVRPPGFDADPKRTAALAAFFANPRVDGWLQAPPAGAPRRTWRVTAADGVRTLELGGDADRVWIRDLSDPARTGYLMGRTVRAIEAIVGG